MIETPGRIKVQTYQKTKKANDVCGDSYFFKETDHFFLSCLADGLGSGEIARESSDVIVHIVEKYLDKPSDVILQKCNKALIGSGKRGAVVGLLRIDFNERRFTYAYIGNITLFVFSNNDVKRNIPSHGYFPSHRNNYSFFEGELKNNSTFLMFSDGFNASQIKRKFTGSQSVKETINELEQTDHDDDATLITMTYANEAGD